MPENEINTIQQFYVIYAKSCREGFLSREEWDIVNEAKTLTHLNQELESMVHRIQHCVNRKQIILGT